VRPETRPRPQSNGNRSDYERRLAAAESLRGRFGRDPSRSFVDELADERRAEARAEDLEDEAYRLAQAQVRARAGR
jgi:hypothetical protein